jgi:hypothetical protein
MIFVSYFCELFFGKYCFEKSCAVQKIFKKSHFNFNNQKIYVL